jgi:biotin synthase
MSDEMQALCFLAGANSIFYGEKLLTTGNPDVERDRKLFTRLGLKPEQRPAEATADTATAGARAGAQAFDAGAAARSSEAAVTSAAIAVAAVAVATT